jgi:prepilin-type N-terminal cleavage/methylation domain-containing protein
MMLVTKERFLREEGGFTFIELMITITIWLAVLLALYGIFDMGVRVFRVGNNKVEAVESARVGLAKMERELRQAYSYDSGSGQNHLFWTSGTPTTPAFPAATSVTFGNDLNGNRQIDVATEEITYALNGTTLRRNGEPAVESVEAVTFEYLDVNRVPVASGVEGDIAMVRIVLVVTEDPNTDLQATQRLTTEVDLRNR